MATNVTSTANGHIRVKFWGVCGSIPRPLDPAEITDKIAQGINLALQHGLTRDANPEHIRTWMERELTFEQRSTYGGNTTCVEVMCDDELIILDMGTGIRPLGNDLLKRIFASKKAIKGTILQSHMHWDHIQGFPFWKLLYLPNTLFANEFTFYGGREWDKSLEDVLKGQMNAPVFPVDLREIAKTGLRMHFETVWDGRQIEIPTSNGPIKILCQKLHHPQETYGYRIEYCGEIFTFCTDHEPFAAVDRKLITLAQNADIFVTDCQYSEHDYSGHAGKVQKIGWGHSFPGYIAEVVRIAQPKLVITTHHEPDSSDEQIAQLAQEVERLSGITTYAANEGLTLTCLEAR